MIEKTFLILFFSWVLGGSSKPIYQIRYLGLDILGQIGLVQFMSTQLEEVDSIGYAKIDHASCGQMFSPSKTWGAHFTIIAAESGFQWQH